MTYRDLAEHGVLLVTPGDPSFAGMVQEIEALLAPFAPRAPVDPDRAAVLLNQGGKVIVVLAYMWRYAGDGRPRTSRFSNLGSSMQLDVLTGRTEAARDRASFILPGSKRLITEQGVFGNNHDVLAEETRGYCGGWGGRFRTEESAPVKLLLDLVIFEDGTCVGPDEDGLFDRLTASLEQQRRASQDALAALREGASVGRIFEIVRPLAKDRSPRESPLAGMFGNMAIHQLVHTDGAELLAWFELAAQEPARRLRRVTLEGGL
jgi:hypothetical protein